MRKLRRPRETPLESQWHGWGKNPSLLTPRPVLRPFTASPLTHRWGGQVELETGVPPAPAEPQLHLKSARSFDNCGGPGCPATSEVNSLSGFFWPSSRCCHHGDHSRSYPGLLSPRKAKAQQNHGHPVHVLTLLPRQPPWREPSALSAGIPLFLRPRYRPCLLSVLATEGAGEQAVPTSVLRKTQLRPGRVHTHSYKEEGCHTASRSGHCAALLQTAGPQPAHQLLLFGGCNSPEPEVAGHWSPGKIKEEPPAAPRLMEQLARLVSTGQGSRQGPRGLRHHSCSVVGPFAVLFGGETLTRARDTICNDLYIYDTRKSPSLWFHFPCADHGLKRVGHRTCLWNDQLYLVGGFGEDGRTPSPQVCILDLFI
uniref:Kelch domain containing 9 n=1 Tax=Ailuropoda melanoleuca TaxID=9646 RepID=A0A7N5K0H6_AILME